MSGLILFKVSPTFQQPDNATFFILWNIRFCFLIFNNVSVSI